jgi:YbbR domain-containing protein
MTLRWKELLIAFVMALGIWYIVSGSEKIVSQIEARADYRGLPQGMLVRSGTVGKVSVRIRASVGMLHSLSSRDFAFFVDLSSVKKGENVLSINLSQLALPGGVEVMDISPSRIYLEVDTVESKLVPLRANIEGELPGDYTAEANLDPAEVKISGATAQIEKITQLTVPVKLENPPVPGIIESMREIPLPEGVECSPAKVKLSMYVGIKRKLVQVMRPVNISEAKQFNLRLQPDKVRISLAVPDSFAGKIADDQRIRAHVQLERPEPGNFSLPVQVELHTNIELVKVEPASVSVTVERKPPSQEIPQSVKAAPAKPKPSRAQASGAKSAKARAKR